ncbi:hypothetical protein BCR34DRAFT_571969 [Clohesyomyces aquaticus]|uniref:Uncharacterized protein n=1 Tax=Clohesyomyces aquaticus TaxID=1231657 RepID=A0A1Y1Z5J3_9PLEO|nr:hypothetical protein BCR34DRAFT_571969 [Clohesyomyces aquaticus]
MQFHRPILPVVISTVTGQTQSSCQSATHPVSIPTHTDSLPPSGVPPNHPGVIAQGYDPKQVRASPKADAAAILEKGYNRKGVRFCSHNLVRY